MSILQTMEMHNFLHNQSTPKPMNHWLSMTGNISFNLTTINKATYQRHNIVCCDATKEMFHKSLLKRNTINTCMLKQQAWIGKIVL